MLDSERISEIVRKYPERRGALLPALHLAQKEYGWLSPEAMKEVSRALNLPEATVKGVATFYAMYRKAPAGRHLVQICTNVACMIFGAERLVDLLKERYGLEPGGTSEDGRFSLMIMECIGACDRAPAMLVNEDYYPDLNEERIMTILEGYE